MYRILVVDDERLICEGMRKALDQLGLFQTHVAHSGFEALDVMRAHTIDAMLLDIAMPDMSGIELMRALSDAPEKPATIVISGYEEFAYAQQALAFGALDYLLKPIDAEDVANIGRRLWALVDARAREKQEIQRMRVLVDDLLARQMRDEDERPPQAACDSPQRVAERVKRALEQHYADPKLSVNRLAAMLNYSPNYLGSVFKRAYDLSINDYLSQYRIAEAKRLMEETDLLIYEVAFRVGFGDQQYFSKTFKKCIGLSPSEYRTR
jgi:two-component system response regulator YesN